MYKKTISFIFIVVFACLLPVNVLALKSKNSTDVTLRQMEESDKNYYLNKFSIEVLDKNSNIYKNSFIYNFDVSEEGRCAVFFDNATVVIFDSNGIAENVLKFNEDILNVKVPSDVLIKWNKNVLQLIWGYDVVCFFTVDGEIIDINKHESDMHTLHTREQITVNENTYEIEYSNFFIHFMGGKRYDLFTKTNISGEKTVLFDCEKSLPNSTISVILFILVLNAVILFVVIKILVGLKRQGTKKRNTGDGSVC